MARGHISRASAPSEEGRRARRRRETRAALLHAGLQIIRKQGVYGTRIEDITERADVAKGVFYLHFSSKEALIGALVETGIEILDRDYLVAVEGDDVATRVEGIARAHEAFFTDHPHYSLLFHQARGLLQLDKRGTSALRTAFVGYLERVAAPLTGMGLGPAALADLAAAVAGAVAGYRSFRIATRAKVEPKTVAAILSGGVEQFVSKKRRGGR